MRTPPPPDSPSWTDPTVSRASRLIGGPIGRYAATASQFWTPLRVLLLLCMFTLLLGYAQKSPCANAQWQFHRQYTQFCYSDVIPLWGGEQLDVGAVPYRDHAVEYPVLTGGFMWLTASITHGIGDVTSAKDLVVVFGVVTCILLAVFALLTLLGTVGAAGRRPWDAALFALSPLLIFHAFSNWDLIAMALAALALWAWARQRVVAAGVLLGLGTAAKLYPALLLIPLWILAVRTRRYREAGWCTAAAGLAWLAVNLPVASAYFDGWKEFYVFSSDRPAEASTVWQIAHYVNEVGLFGGNPGSFHPPGIAVAAAVAVAIGVVVWLGLNAPVKPRLAQLAFLVVVAFLLTTKVWSPQYSVWLVPLLALARPRWRISILWQFSEIVVWMVTLLWLSTGGDSFTAPSRGPTYGWVALACVIRDIFLLVICALIVREMWRPELDVVRSDGLDDPGGGVFDGADDHHGRAARQVRQQRNLAAAFAARDVALADDATDPGAADDTDVSQDRMRVVSASPRRTGRTAAN